MLLISDNLKHGPRQAIGMEKPLETAWVGPKVGSGKASGNHQVGTNSVSLVDGASDMVPTCQLCGSVRGGLRKGTVPMTTLLSGRNLHTPSPVALMSNTSVPSECL